MKTISLKYLIAALIGSTFLFNACNSLDLCPIDNYGENLLENTSPSTVLRKRDAFKITQY